MREIIRERSVREKPASGVTMSSTAPLSDTCTGMLSEMLEDSPEASKVCCARPLSTGLALTRTCRESVAGMETPALTVALAWKNTW